MRISSGSGPSIGRRRGTARNGGKNDMILTPKSILILLAIVFTIFTMGLVVGTRLFGTPSPNDTTNNNANMNGNSSHNASPLIAATSKLPNSDVQKLIMESAAAEVIEKKQHVLEEQAIAKGDKKLAAHLRGALVEGDANYNPHHHVDDVLDDDETKRQGAGDGGMYAGDNGDHREVHAENNELHQEDGEDSMHNHFLDALKNEMQQVKKDEEKIVNSIKSEVVTLKDKAKDVAHKLRGGLHTNNNNVAMSDNNVVDSLSSSENVESNSQYYPYMTLPISTTFNFQQYEPLGGNRFVEYKNGDSPYQITKTLISQSDDLARSRRYHVKEAMKHIWTNYKEYAFGMDELHPISKRGTSNWGGMGTT